ncbi:hypothetical protein B9Z55_002765 [Caenorhabditis nigoni]|uniref:Uncharacterized protein n=1 Tax=Caenorhabditis nigoni TaxID=1611254 RepID=A0A2G5VM14_9PELO|nr:hypothetical protein B9Z55_002765 [Caenorhabditis nigoni]
MCDFNLENAKRKAGKDEIENFRKELEVISQKRRDEERENAEKVCSEFFSTKEYEDKETYGYGVCCEIYDLCGISGWTIFLIILIVLLILAGAGAAFWFFYLKRKLGGREKNGEDSLSEESSDYDISVEDTY